MQSQKTTLAIFLLTLFTIGCSPASPYDKARTKAEAKLKESMNDPSTYELVSFTIWDSLSHNDIAEYRRKIIDETMEIQRDNIQKMEDLNLLSPGFYTDGDISAAKEGLAESMARRAKVDAKADSLGANAQSVASYTFHLKYRGNNALGAKVLSECYVQTTPAPEFDVLNIAETTGDLKSNPFQ